MMAEYTYLSQLIQKESIFNALSYEQDDILDLQDELYISLWIKSTLPYSGNLALNLLLIFDQFTQNILIESLFVKERDFINITKNLFINVKGFVKNAKINIISNRDHDFHLIDFNIKKLSTTEKSSSALLT